MKKYILLILIILIALAIPALNYFYTPQEKSAEEWSWDSDWYESFELANGLKVFVVPNNKIPAVSHMLWYKTGAMDEPRGKSGIAHFLEHLLFKGTDKFADGEFSKIVAQNGGQENAFTSQDFTAYYQNIAKDKLPLLMEMEADRMRGLTLTEEQIAKERAVIIEERNSRVDNKPRALLREQMDAALFMNHPYGTALIGWKHEMEKLGMEDALDFYKKYYAPNNAFLILAGDINAAEARLLVEKYYGGLKPSEDIDRIELIEPPQIAERRIILRDERVKQPEFWRSYIAPSQTTGASEHAYALQVMDKILSGGQVSRLYQSLVIEQKLASAAGGFYSDIVRGNGEYTLYGLPAADIELATLEKAFDAEIEKLIKNGVTQAEIASAKKALIAEMIYSREGLQQLAYMLGQVVSVGLDPEYISNWSKNIEAVTAQQVQAAAEYLFDKNKSVTGELYGE